MKISKDKYRRNNSMCQYKLGADLLEGRSVEINPGQSLEN